VASAAEVTKRSTLVYPVDCSRTDCRKIKCDGRCGTSLESLFLNSFEKELKTLFFR
jgi:hypothetical protein